VTTIFGRQERVRQGGYPTRRTAEQARDDLLERSKAECTTQTWTTTRWLRHWLTTKTGIRPSTRRSYTEHVDRHLIPHLGRIRLGELTGHHVAAMFTTLIAAQTRYGRPTHPVHVAPHPRHPALGPQRSDPRRADPGQPRPARRTTQPTPPAGAGVMAAFTRSCCDNSLVAFRPETSSQSASNTDFPR
jgi:hypothetical protein